jgi:hypothetical protein
MRLGPRSILQTVTLSTISGIQVPMHTPLERYDVFEGSKQLGALWILTNSRANLQCTVSTHRHRLGWQLHLHRGRKLLRTHLCRTEAAVFEIAEDWKRDAQANGWVSTTNVVELEFLMAEVRAGLAFVNLAMQTDEQRRRAQYLKQAMKAYRAAAELRLLLRPSSEANKIADETLGQLRDAIAAIAP